jgi:hypothetical protein
MKQILFALVLTMLAMMGSLEAQFNPVAGCVVDANGRCAPNVILSATPFLRIVPDARSGALGDAGIASSADPNALHFNSSKLAFIDKDMSFSATYTPWLRNLGIKDIYMAYLTGYKKVDDLQTIGMGFRYFSMGEINFTDINGNPTGNGLPREFELAVSYNRKLSDNFSAGLTAKYIHSNLASGQTVGGVLISSANAFAADLSFTYKKKGNLTPEGSEWTLGGAITNLGSKVTYTSNDRRDFIPANFGLGTSLLLNFDEYNSITFLFDVNKLLLPTPISRFEVDEDGNIPVDDQGMRIQNPDWDPDGDGFPDYKEQSVFSAALSSWGDAQGGFGEELQEFNMSLGIEYWYDKQFAARLGYYYENPLKGDRQFITVGAGLKYSVFGMDISYLVPTNNQRNPLDNTLRFTLQFDFAALTGEY